VEERSPPTGRRQIPTPHPQGGGRGRPHTHRGGGREVHHGVGEGRGET